MPIYMRIDNVNGDVTEKGHQNWIKVNDLQFELSRQTKIKTGCANDRSGTVPKFSHIVITKPLDISSTQIFQAACSGKAINKIEIHACHSGSTYTPFAKYILSNVMLTQYSPMIDESMPQESLRLSFTKIEATYLGRDSSNKAGSSQTTGYDLEKAEIV